MRRLPIITQLGSMFGLTIILFVCLLWYSLYVFNSTSDAYEDLLKHTAIRSIAIENSRDNFHRGMADLRAFLLYTDSNSEQASLKEVTESLEAVKTFVPPTKSPQLKTEAEKLQTYLMNYAGTIQQVFAAKKANDPNIGSILAKAREHAAQVDKQFEIVQGMQLDTMNRNTKTISARQDLAALTIQIVNGIVIVLSIILVILYSRNLARRLKNLRGSLLEVTALDLSKPDIQPTRNDEVGDMGLSIIEMKKGLKVIVKNLRESADALAASSEEMLSTVEEQLRTSETIAKTTNEITTGAIQNTQHINEISAVVQEVSAQAQEMSANSHEVTKNTGNAFSDAEHGMDLIRNVVVQNDTIADSMEDISSVAKSLVNGSNEIQEIVTVIHSIAAQTNLLALNAAIEAARAGEAGKGFAVVAEEVRKLAEQSAGATNNIQEIIGRMTKDIDVAVSSVDEASSKVADGKSAARETEEGFNGIMEKLGKVNSGVEQISRAIEETAKGMQTVVSNVQNISAVAEETSASTETVAAATQEQSASLNDIASNAESLTKMANSLNDVVRKFKL
jgi:methyl-accepting chemotaxis protein